MFKSNGEYLWDCKQSIRCWRSSTRKSLNVGSPCTVDIVSGKAAIMYALVVGWFLVSDMVSLKFSCIVAGWRGFETCRVWAFCLPAGTSISRPILQSMSWPAIVAGAATEGHWRPLFIHHRRQHIVGGVRPLKL